MRDQFVGRPMLSSVETELSLGASAIVADAEESDDSASFTTDTPITTQPSTSTDAVSEKPPAKKVMKVNKPSKRQALEEEFLAIEREKINSMKKAIEAQAAQQEQDEWDRFTSSICCDLRKLKDPVLIMQTKINITRDVNQAVMEQLMLDRGTRPSASTNIVPHNAPVPQYQSAYPESVHSMNSSHASGEESQYYQPV